MSDKRDDLRRQAEERLQAGHPGIKDYSAHEFEKLAHELQVHQIELEMQNNELQNTLLHLEKARQRFADLFEHAPVGYFIINSQKQIADVNATAVQMLAIPAHKLVNQHILRIVAESDRDRFLLMFNRLQETGSENIELYFIKGDDSSFPARLECVRDVHEEGNENFRIGFVDISDRVQAEARELQLKMEKEKVRILNEFMTNSSHDLKTPIASLLLGLELMEIGNTNETQIKRLQKLRNQVNRLNKVIDKMFQMTLLDHEEAYEFENINLIILMQNIIEDLNASARRKGQILRHLLPKTPVYAEIDYLMFSRVMHNLIENATRYSPEDAIIDLMVIEKDKQAILSVSDAGCGIAPEEIPRIFERFYRVEQSRNDATGGSGLGLAIAKKIVDAHRGSIEVDSTVGKGTTFRIILPLRRDTAGE